MLATYTRLNWLLLALGGLSLVGSSVAAPEVDELGAASIFDLEATEDQGWRHIKWSTHSRSKRALGKGWTGSTTLARAGVSGVAAMQMSVISDDEVLIYDKAENNALLAKVSLLKTLAELSSRD